MYIQQGSFSVLQVNVFDTMRITLANSRTAGIPDPFIAINPFDPNKHLGAFLRFPEIQGGLFLTVQNPFTLFTAVANATTACQYGVDHPEGDEPGMPLTMPVSDADVCAYSCSADPACVAFAYISGGCHGAVSSVCYHKSSVTPTVSVPSCMCSGLRSPSSQPHFAVSASYTPNMTWSSFPSPSSPGHVCDKGIVGAANLSRYFAPSRINTGEREAFSACVEKFLMDKDAREGRTVKINVAWVSSDERG